MGILKRIWSHNKGFISFIVLMIFMRTAVADFYQIPSGSMKPNILIGDRILVNKLAYSTKIPFTDFSLTPQTLPMRGDIVVFNSKAAKNRLIKRVIGLPGDVISMQNNRLTVNRQPASYRFADSEQQILTEQLLGHKHKLKWQGEPTALSTFDSVKVPQGHVLVLGDNRNNSADSRVYGFVPVNELVGRASRVLFSLDPDKYYLPRFDRAFHRLI